jgi:uncharacterized protein (PEP-CTERM system associated)
VRQFLVNNGIDPNAPVNTGALRSAATLQESLELTAVWTGVRQSVMIMIGRNSTRRIDALGSTVGDLSEVDRVDSSTVALKLGHRLTPSSTLSLHFSSQHNRSEAENRFSRQSQVDLRWQSQLTPDSSAAATLSRSHFYNGLGTSDETALTASYGVRF